MKKHQTTPFGSRVEINKMPSVLGNWANQNNLQFDVIMIGGLSHKSVLPILCKLPLIKLCSRPGFLFIWTSVSEINELNNILNSQFNKKFRRSEELVFLPIDKSSQFYPTQSDTSVFENQQWHCWMCITGTVRRATDQHLIHCNIDTDLQFESFNTPVNLIVPNEIYSVIENFSNANRRLHIIPYKVGYKVPIKLRPGWVIMSPEIFLNNFNPLVYGNELSRKSWVSYKSNTPQYLVKQTNEIEELRPKSPTKS